MVGGCASATDGQAASPDPGSYGSGLTERREGQPLGPGGGRGPTVKVPGGGTATQTGSPPTTRARINDNDGLGRNARLYLSAEVPKLVIEVDAVKGAEPSDAALATLRERLAEITDKPGGVELLATETFSNDRTRWSEDDIIAVQRAQRDRFSTPTAIVLYVLSVRGTYAANDDALGLAYSSSAFVLFTEHIRQVAATPLVSSSAIERAVAVHEMGHVFSLLNIGYTSPREREDPRHEAHSSNADSVMYWAIDNVGVADLLGGRTAPPSTFDEDDRADLNDIRTGRLRSA